MKKNDTSVIPETIKSGEQNTKHMLYTGDQSNFSRRIQQPPLNDNNFIIFFKYTVDS